MFNNIQTLKTNGEKSYSSGLNIFLEKLYPF